MATNQLCAYCGKQGPMTREHIWPKWTYAQTPDYDMMYSERARKVFSGELMIGDVCAACNNGTLSDLDAYVKDLHQAFFVHFAERNTSVEFRYD